MDDAISVLEGVVRQPPGAAVLLGMMVFMVAVMVGVIYFLIHRSADEDKFREAYLKRLDDTEKENKKLRREVSMLREVLSSVLTMVDASGHKFNGTMEHAKELLRSMQERQP